MAFDKDRLFEVENGIKVTSADGVNDFVMVGGPNEPLGIDLPVGTIYTQSTATGPVSWYKSGAGVNDWEIFSNEITGPIEVYFERYDSQAFTGTVGTSWTAVPAVAGNAIRGFIVTNDVNNDVEDEIQISLDNGTTTLDVIYPSGFYSQMLNDSFTQIYIRSNNVGTNYKITLNRVF